MASHDVTAKGVHRARREIWNPNCSRHRLGPRRAATDGPSITTAIGPGYILKLRMKGQPYPLRTPAQSLTSSQVKSSQGAPPWRARLAAGPPLCGEFPFRHLRLLPCPHSCVAFPEHNSSFEARSRLTITMYGFFRAVHAPVCRRDRDGGASTRDFLTQDRQRVQPTDRVRPVQ